MPLHVVLVLELHTYSGNYEVKAFGTLSQQVGAKVGVSAAGRIDLPGLLLPKSHGSTEVFAHGHRPTGKDETRWRAVTSPG